MPTEVTEEEVGGCVEGGAGAQSQSSDWWVRLKQNLHLRALAWPVKAIFQMVGLILAQTVSVLQLPSVGSGDRSRAMFRFRT